jgi:ribosomal protein S18 acetylase RimI-like enzyme
MKDIIKNNKKQIRLQVLKVNQRAKEFYERLGFEITGEEKYHYKMVYERK